ncbi:hypothetical protein PILCRDRAFT_823051 [Piloderma croceum F 1598]|uniref:Uncharacterized protein n=1 Tax=Piloderma croceum (strain F 1598) TaxID=765440 RepID=A0A0C3FK32_PILCF|nr:hypothetical protein PILCRDRAFT_823051 [Piloderma croceum F 1598]
MTGNPASSSAHYPNSQLSDKCSCAKNMIQLSPWGKYWIFNNPNPLSSQRRV